MADNTFWTEREINTRIERYTVASDHERLVNLALEARKDHRPSLWRSIIAALAVRRQSDPCVQDDPLTQTLVQEPC